MNPERPTFVKCVTVVGVSLCLCAGAPAQSKPTVKVQIPKAAAPAPAKSATAARPGADPQSQAKLRDILARWEKVSASMNTLYAEYRLTEELAVVGKTTSYIGKAYLQRPNKAMIWRESPPKKEGDKPEFKGKIVCTGTEVADYSPAEKLIMVYPLPKDARQRALEEGPLPFLFDMKADNLLARYHVTYEAESKRSYRIRFEPRQDIDRDAFSKAWIDLNKETLLPDALFLMAANGKDAEKYRFNPPKPNVKLPADTFDIKVWQGYKLVKNPPPAGSETAEDPAASTSVPLRPAQPKRAAAAPNVSPRR